MGALASAYVTNLIKLPWLQSSHFHTAYRLHRKSESKTEVTVWDPWTAHYLTVCHTPSLTSVCLWAWCVCVGCANCRSTRNVFRCTLARKFWTVTMMNVTCTLFSHHLTWVTCEVCAVLSCNYCCFFFFQNAPQCTYQSQPASTLLRVHTWIQYVHINTFTPCTQEILRNTWCTQIDLALDNNQLTGYARRSRTGISLNRNWIHQRSHLLGVLFDEESRLQNQRTRRLLFCLGSSFDFRLMKVHHSGESRRQEKAMGVTGPQAPLKVAIPSLKCYLLQGAGWVRRMYCSASSCWSSVITSLDGHWNIAVFLHFYTLVPQTEQAV